MLDTITSLNRWAEAWLKLMEAVLWQSLVLIAIAAVLVWLLRRSSPVLRYWLWQIVALKLLLMPFWTFALPMPFVAESKPQDQSTVTQLSYDPNLNFDRMQLRDSLPLPKDSPVESVPQSPPFWQPLTTITWQGWLLFVWITVIILQFIRLIIQRIRLAKLLKQGSISETELVCLVAELASQIRLARVPAVVSVAGDCPLFVCGIWRPRIVLPNRLMASLDSAKRRQVILHELAHIKRHDLIWGWPIEIARIVYFFNPLVYWAAYQLRLERELACDQLAMAHSGHSPGDYAKTLVQVVSHASEPSALQAALSAGLTGSEILNDK